MRSSAWMRWFAVAILAWGMTAAGQQAKPAAAHSAAAARTSTAEKIPVIKYEKYKLKNGLEVILSENHRLPLVAVDIWYHVGPANERPGRTGFAHLFEHMMFQGSKHVGDEPFKVLEASGATLINGTTDFDRTNYFETMPSNELDTALWLESDRMGWLLDKLDQKKLTTQKDVVRNERRQGESQPYDLAEEETFHLLFPKGHPYYGVVIGSHADIESAELTDVRNFFKTYYAPNNATLVIVGDYDPKTIKAQVEKYFEPIPSGPPKEPVKASFPAITKEKDATVTDTVQLPRVYMVWHTPAIFKPGDADADLLGRILGGGKSSRLYKKLVYEKQIAQDVSAEQQSLMLGSVFTIQATARPGVTPEQLKQAIDEELATIRQSGPSQAEVQRARNTIETRMIQGLQRLGGFGGIADVLNAYNHYLGDPGYFPKDVARYDAATPASVKRLADSLTPNSRAVVYCVPGEKHVEDVPRRQEQASSEPVQGGPGNDEWRNTPPQPGPEKTPHLPVPAVFTLKNGMKVYLTEDHQVPVMTASLAVLRGSEANPADKPGLASFTASMLTEGTEKRSATQLADDIAQTGGSLTANSTADVSAVDTSGLTKNADALFGLLSDVAEHPAFRQEEIERLRKRRLVALLQENDNPNTLATKVFYQQVYGPKSPYGYTETGTEESNRSVTRQDLENFYREGYGPKNSALLVAGDFTEPQLKSLAEKWFGGWTGDATASKPPQIEGELARKVVIVDKPGSPQSVLRIGEVGLQRNNPDYPQVAVMNEILGGLFSSRINLNLREAHGYTYGAFSAFAYRRGRGPFLVGSMVRTDVTAPAVHEVFNELDKMRATAPSAGEVDMAKESLERGLTAQFETTGQTAATMRNLFTYDLPIDYYRDLPAKFAAVTPAEVQQMAEKYLTPDKMVVVVTGDKAKIESGLKELSLGPTETVEATGKGAAKE